jgi:hypothetical protein
MSRLTMQRIAAVQADVATALARSSAGSTLSAAEQDRLLAQACIESCELLRDWLDDPWWSAARHGGKRPAREFVPAQDEFANFLGTDLKAYLNHAREAGIDVGDELIDEAYEKVKATTRRFPRLSRDQLFAEAQNRVGSLRSEVCQLASQAADDVKSAAWRRNVRKALVKVSGLLLTMVLTVAGPQTVAHDVAGWGHAAVQVVDVLTLHHAAGQAQPGTRVAPPHAGPRVR